MMNNKKARNKREELRLKQEQQAKEAKLRKIIGLSLGVLLVLALVVTGIVISQTRGNDTAGDAIAGVVAPKHLTKDGSFRILDTGSVDTSADDTAKEGKERVQVIFDAMCPGCGAVDRALGDTLLDSVKAGDIDLYVSPVAFLDNTSTDQYSTRAANAVATVASESPEHLYPFIRAIFETENQPHEGSEYVPVTNERFTEIAESVGVPSDKASLISEETYKDWVARHSAFTMNRKDLFRSGFSTPAVFVGGTLDEDGNVNDVERVSFTSEKPIVESFTEVLTKVKEDN